MPLAALALRRTLPFGLLMLLAPLLLLSALHDWGAPPEVLEALGSDAPARAAARQGVWLLAAFALVPALALRAASTVPGWRRADAAWLAPRPAGRLACVLATLAGTWCAILILLGLFFAAAEAAAGADAPAERFVRAVAHPAMHVLNERGAVCELDLSAEELGEHSILRLRPLVAPGGGQAADLRAEVRAGGVVLGAASAHLAGRAAIDVPLAHGATEGPLELLLVRTAPGAIVVLPEGSVSLLDASSRERSASAAALAELLVLLVPLTALALGLGAWMRAAIAAPLALCLWVPAWSWGLARGFLPGGELFATLQRLGDGLVAPWPPARALGGALLVACGGVALAVRGLRSWGATP